MDIIIN